MAFTRQAPRTLSSIGKYNSTLFLHVDGTFGFRHRLGLWLVLLILLFLGLGFVFLGVCFPFFTLLGGLVIVLARRGFSGGFPRPGSVRLAINLDLAFRDVVVLVVPSFLGLLLCPSGGFFRFFLLTCLVLLCFAASCDMVFGVKSHNVSIAMVAEDQIDFVFSGLTTWEGGHCVFVHLGKNR